MNDRSNIQFIFNPIQQEEIDLIKEVNKVLTEKPPTEEEIFLKQFARACFYQKKKKLIEQLKQEKHIEISPKEKETIVIKLEQPEIKEIKYSSIPIYTGPPPRINISQTFQQSEAFKHFQNEVKHETTKPIEIPKEELSESFSEFHESSFEHSPEIKAPKEPFSQKPSGKNNGEQKEQILPQQQLIEEPPSPPTTEKFTDLVIDNEGKSIVKVRLIKDNLSGDLFYEVQEPSLDNHLFMYTINKNLKPTDKNFDTYVEKYCKKLNLTFNQEIVDALRYHLFKYNSPFGPIDPLIHDSSIILISSTLTSLLIIKYKTGEVMKTNIKIESADYVDFIRNLGALIGKKLSVKEPSAEGIYQNFKFTLNTGGMVKPSFTIERLN